MELILLERIAKLGNLGDVVNVKPGYARNYLLPQGKALRATAANREYFEQEKTQLEEANARKRTDAEGIAAGLENRAFVLIRQAGESGQLYGSVNAPRHRRRRQGRRFRRRTQPGRDRSTDQGAWPPRHRDCPAPGNRG